MSPDPVMLALVAVLVTSLALAGFFIWKNTRVPPEERERRRRAELAASGKVSDATLTEIRENFLFYAYVVRGVEYTASQDVSFLHPYVPPDLSALSAVAVRYDPRNPADSIVVSEQWSGLRTSGALLPVMRRLE